MHPARFGTERQDRDVDVRSASGAWVGGKPSDKVACIRHLFLDFVAALIHLLLRITVSLVTTEDSVECTLTRSHVCACCIIVAPIPIQRLRLSTSIQNKNRLNRKSSSILLVLSPTDDNRRWLLQYRHAYDRVGEMQRTTRASRSFTWLSARYEFSSWQILNFSSDFMISKQR